MISATDTSKGDFRPQTIEFPPLRSREELDAHIEKTYGADVRDALHRSVDEQEDVIRELHERGLNGNAEALERTYKLHRQEMDRKETLLDKTWKVVTWPFGKAWEFAKKHPGVALLIVAAGAAAGIGLYYAGIGDMLVATVPNYSAEAAAVAKEASGVAGDIGLEGAGQLSPGIAQAAKPAIDLGLPAGSSAPPMPPMGGQLASPVSPPMSGPIIPEVEGLIGQSPK